MILRTQIKLIIYILLLIGLSACATLLLQGDWRLFAVVVGLIMIAIGIAIFRTLANTATKVAYMFDAIENDDFTFRFTGSHARVGNDKFLNHSLNRIKDLVLQARIAAREHEKYYETILSKVQTGVIVFNSQGVVFRTNPQALKILGTTQLTHIRQLESLSPDIPQQFMDVKDGESCLVKFYNEVSEVSLNIIATHTILQNTPLTIVAFTDIADDMDSVQVESWRKMSRVLTHEIMNSLAPITSLSEALLTADDPIMVKRGLEIINSTSANLKHFVENYRAVTRIPEPTLEDIDLAQLVCRETELMCGNIRVTIASSDCIVAVDKGQISQVIVNLLKNAVEAVCAAAGDPNNDIWVDVARNAKGRLCIDVCNKGIIPDEIRDNIFVPFYTQKVSGNGIGLSLSRQIMRLHQGSLTLATRPYTKFRIQFQ